MNTIVSSCSLKLVKFAIKTACLHRLKPLDDKLRAKYNHFWKYVSKFKRNGHTYPKYDFIREPQFIVVAFDDHYRSAINS